MPFVCACGHKARDNYNLSRHRKSCHQESSVDKVVTCFHCRESFARKSSLAVHVETHQKTEPAPERDRGLQCPLCSSKRRDRPDIEAHLSQDHQISFEKTILSFENEEHFLKWKANVERSTVCCYVAKRGSKKLSSGKKTITFHCFRSGSSRCKPLESRKRLPFWLGSPRIGACCPAYIKMTSFESGKVKVVYSGRHVGHDFKVGRLSLSKSYRKSLAVKMRMKMSLEEILASEREKGKQGSELQLQRSLLLTRKDLHNIAKEFGVNKDVIRHDAVSVEAWITQNLASEKPWVRYHKFNGVIDSQHSNLQLDDFILILMSDAQLEILRQYGTHVVCVDGTNGYGFEMITVLVQNDRKEGFPVATMFSSRSDTDIMALFFTYIRELCGEKINCRIFMTDITEIYYQAWVKVMGSPSLRLFSAWHIDRAWRNNLSKIKEGLLEKKEVYQRVKIVQMERDVQSFLILFKNLISELLANDCTQAFGEYLRDYYGSNTENWAYCHRLHAGITPNIERMNGVSNYLCLKGKKTKRLDKILQTLQNFVSDKCYDEFMSSNKEKLSKKLQMLRRKHEIYRRENEKMKIEQLDANEWVVSSTTFHGLYNVRKVSNSCANCYLKCEWCNACTHSYVCTCLDSAVRGNMCKHIHKVSADYAVKSRSDGPSIVNEMACDDFLNNENRNAGENVKQADLHEILNRPSPISLSLNEEIEKVGEEFLEVARTIRNAEELEATRQSLASLEAALSALRECSSVQTASLPPLPQGPPNKLISPQKKIRKQAKPQRSKICKAKNSEASRLSLSLVLPERKGQPTL